MSTLATRPTTTAPLLPAEAEAVAALHARRDALARSEPARRCRLFAAAVQVMIERAELLLAEVPKDIGRKVLADAGLTDPVDAARFGSDVFGAFLDGVRTLSEELDSFWCLVGSDIPHLPTEEEVRHVG